ncbi:MAG TPA: hypothetical protein VM166_04465 [Gemmatimonadaceae bacterium]|nr:hypothetical protein [Gemmatimonadaceae bacterium]
MKFLPLAFALTVVSVSAGAQQGYEFEVYGAGIAKPRSGELELHTNFVPKGSQLVDDAEGRATHRAFRSSFEVSTGITSWLEASGYVVGYARHGAGIDYVGNRLRLTAVVPERFNFPIDLGLAQEVGYARPGFAEHRWAYEVTPIVAKGFGPLELTVNPAFEVSLDRGEKEWEFEPRAKIEYGFGDDGALGLEYYSVLGPVEAFDARSHQRHQLFVVGETELPSGLELGLGVGRGLTKNSDRWVVSTRLEISF